MLKLSLVVMFVLSLATLSFASSLMPMPGTHDPIYVTSAAEAPMLPELAETEPRLWVHTFE